MSFDTTNQNKSRQNLESFDEIWVFGYGSLIYKVDFPILEKRPASIRGWQRRFWQGSHDHRGTPEAPGRVVTLVEKEDAVCAGIAYRVSHDVFEHLDHREKNGYLRYEIDIDFDQNNDASNDASHKALNSITGLVYIGLESSEAFLGPASEPSIAAQIHQSIGPSGRNDEYVFQLAEGLRQLNEEDEHVFAIEKLLFELTGRSSNS